MYSERWQPWVGEGKKSISVKTHRIRNIGSRFWNSIIHNIITQSKFLAVRKVCKTYRKYHLTKIKFHSQKYFSPFFYNLLARHFRKLRTLRAGDRIKKIKKTPNNTFHPVLQDENRIRKKNARAWLYSLPATFYSLASEGSYGCEMVERKVQLFRNSPKVANCIYSCHVMQRRFRYGTITRGNYKTNLKNYINNKNNGVKY